jgi:hypothetical protein
MARPTIRAILCQRVPAASEAMLDACTNQVDLAGPEGSATNAFYVQSCECKDRGFDCAYECSGSGLEQTGYCAIFPRAAQAATAVRRREMQLRRAVR